MTTGLLLDLSVPLDRFTLAVRWETEASFLGIFGHSGAGKTTILEAIAGLRPRAAGIVRVGGRPWLDTGAGVRLKPEERGVGYVPQETLLFPHRDVLGNVLAGRRRARNAGRAPDPAKVIGVLELDGLERRAVSTLSGGEKRRVALARALCSGPEMLLLDEPLAGLDLPLRRRILPYLLRIHETFALPTIVVSHDPTEIRILGEEVLVLSEGRRLACGPPDRVFTDPRVFQMARSEGFENTLEGRILDSAEGIAGLELPAGLRLVLRDEGFPRGQRVIVGLRAEDLILAVEPPRGLSAQNVLPGMVRDLAESPGPDAAGGGVAVVVGLAGSDQFLISSISRQARRNLGLRPGLPVHVVFKAHACRVLAVL